MNKSTHIIFNKKFEIINDKINPVEKSILKNGIEFYYTKNTTIKDCFLMLNKLFDGINKTQTDIPYNKINSNRSLEYLYRIVINNKLIYIFDLETKIEKIIEYIGKNELEIILTLLIEKGGELYRTNGIKFYMNSREGNKHHHPHVHIKYNEYRASISLIDFRIIGDLPIKILNKAMKIIHDNRESFLLKWYTETDGHKGEFKDYQINRTF